MTQLPNEILSEIFSYLHQHDKLKCMLICRRWKQAIEYSVLYHDISISSEATLNKLTKKIQNQPDIVNKIQTVGLYIGDKFDPANLVVFLPLLNNLRELRYISGNRLLTTGTTTQYPQHKHIEHIKESLQHAITYSLLSSNVYTRLKTLNITDFERNIIPYLQNAPALESLTLGGSNISLDDLEHIHVNVPNLASLYINQLAFEDTIFDMNIEPATSVTKCTFDRLWVQSVDTRTDILNYICKKYPNLSKLTLNFGKLGGGLNDDINKLNQHGWNPLFQKLGPKLKQLFIGDSDCTDSMFETLDKFSCQIEHLKIRVLPYTTFAKIEKSQQIRYIQTLALQNMEFDSFSWLNQFQVLNKLKLENVRYSPPRNTIYLNDIIKNSPPTLRILSLRNTSIIVNLKNTRLSNIETLSLFYVTLPEKADTFINQCFPRLQKLKLKHCNLIGRTFNLPALSLSHLRFNELNLFNNSNSILIETSSNSKRLWYSTNDRGYENPVHSNSNYSHHPVDLSKKLVSSNKIESIPHFTFSCNSLIHYSFAL